MGLQSFTAGVLPWSRLSLVQNLILLRRVACGMRRVREKGRCEGGKCEGVEKEWGSERIGRGRSVSLSL